MIVPFQTRSDRLAQQQADYAERWARLVVQKRDADLRRGVEMPLEYYIHDGIRRILVDLGIEEI